MSLGATFNPGSGIGRFLLLSHVAWMNAKQRGQILSITLGLRDDLIGWRLASESKPLVFLLRPVDGVLRALATTVESALRDFERLFQRFPKATAHS